MKTEFDFELYWLCQSICVQLSALNMYNMYALHALWYEKDDTLLDVAVRRVVCCAVLCTFALSICYVQYSPMYEYSCVDVFAVLTMLRVFRQLCHLCCELDFVWSYCLLVMILYLRSMFHCLYLWLIDILWYVTASCPLHCWQAPSFHSHQLRCWLCRD